MRLTMILLLITAQLAPARDWRKVWRVSATILAGAVAIDAASSRGGLEQNPLLGRGPFGARQTAIMAGTTAGSLIWQWRRARRRCPDDPRWRNQAIANFLSAGVHAGVAIHNWRQR